jgi:hypothetical protein
MKTTLTYGFALALGGALLSLVLYFLGFHSDIAKLQAANWIGNIGGLALGISCIVLGIKARRAEEPASENFGYGRALGTGVLITLWAALIGIATNYLYFQVVNPGFRDLLLQAQLDKLEATGVTGDRLEQSERMLRMGMTPVIISCVGFVLVMFWGTVISLIAAAFLKREAAEAVAVDMA